jgi:hypothetical protein
MIKTKEFTTFHAQVRKEGEAFERKIRVKEVEQYYNSNLKKKEKNRRLQNIIKVVKRYNITNLPPFVTMDQLRLEEKRLGKFEHNIYAIFHCKDDCESIMNYDNLLEMRRFSDGLIKDPLWAMFCARYQTEIDKIDSSGCTPKAYINLTSQLNENLIEDWKNKS